MDYDKLFSAYINNTPVSAVVKDQNENGYSLELLGFNAFMHIVAAPKGFALSQSKELDVIIQKIMPATGNIMVSGIAAQEILQKETAQILKVGEIYPAKIIGFKNFLTLVKINKISLALPDSELTNVKKIDPQIFFGDRKDILVKVLDITEKNGKPNVKISHAATLDNEWEALKKKEGEIVNGEIVGIPNYGLFVKIGNLTGLLHETELAWFPLKFSLIKDNYSPGDKIDVKILSVDIENKTINLADKDKVKNPWTDVDKVVNDTNPYEATILEKLSFGFTLGLPNKMYGLLHVNKFGMPKDQAVELMERLNIGDTLPVFVSGFDEKKNRLDFSLLPK